MSFEGHLSKSSKEPRSEHPTPQSWSRHHFLSQGHLSCMRETTLMRRFRDLFRKFWSAYLSQARSVRQSSPLTPERIRSDTALCIFVCIMFGWRRSERHGMRPRTDEPPITFGRTYMTLTPGCVISRLKLNRKGMGNEWPKDYGGMD